MGFLANERWLCNQHRCVVFCNDFLAQASVDASLLLQTQESASKDDVSLQTKEAASQSSGFTLTKVARSERKAASLNLKTWAASKRGPHQVCKLQSQ